MNIEFRKYRLWIVNPDGSISLILAGIDSDWIDATGLGDAVERLVERNPSIYPDGTEFLVERQHSRNMRKVSVVSRETVVRVKTVIV